MTTGLDIPSVTDGNVKTRNPAQESSLTPEKKRVGQSGRTTQKANSGTLTVLVKVARRLFSVLRERHQLLLRQVPVM